MALYWPTLQFYVCVYVSFVCRYTAPPGECCYNTVLCCDDYFSSSSALARAFSAPCMYSKFRHHPHPLGYLCAKFCFFRSPRRIIVYSITHPASLSDAPGTEACTSEHSNSLQQQTSYSNYT